MKFAVIDTETSGLFNFAEPADAPGQPRLANLAIITLDADLGVIEEQDHLIMPDGWDMGAEASAINGLTTAQLLEQGRPIAQVLERYVALIDAGWIIATYNAQFDTKIMRGELRRLGLPDRFESTPNICIMRALTSICRVPKKTGVGFKFPKLAEACAFFKIDQPKAHSALGDARSAHLLLRELKKLNSVPVPEVHYAKNRPV